MSSPTPEPLPAGSKAKLTVVRGVRAGKTYALKEGINYIGREGKFPVDVDLSEQERQIFIDNRHACVYFQNGMLAVADPGSSRGVYLNRVKLAPGKKHPLKADDVVQLGNVALQVKVILKKKTAAQK
ncbi:MAG: FHA domain-containing protein [Gemmataceae bacterium]